MAGEPDRERLIETARHEAEVRPEERAEDRVLCGVASRLVDDAQAVELRAIEADDVGADQGAPSERASSSTAARSATRWTWALGPSAAGSAIEPSLATVTSVSDARPSCLSARSTTDRPAMRSAAPAASSRVAARTTFAGIIGVSSPAAR